MHLKTDNTKTHNVSFEPDLLKVSLIILRAVFKMQIYSQFVYNTIRALTKQFIRLFYSYIHLRM